MALTDLVLAISNGPFEQSVDEGGDQEGTSTGLTATTLTDTAQAWTINEFAGFRLIPNREDGTSFAVLSNTATAILVSGDMTTVATSGDAYRVGDGQAGRFYPESVGIEGDLNEPKTLTLSVISDVVGSESAEDESDSQNAVQLGARLQMWRSSKRVFDGHISSDPVSIDADNREVSITAHDRLAVLDRAIVPAGVEGVSDTFGEDTRRFQWQESTPTLEHIDVPITQTLGFENFTYAIDPIVIGGAGTPAIAAATSSGTTLKISSGFNTPRIEKGCRVVNLTDGNETYVATYVSDTEITTVGGDWAALDEFIILDKGWQLGVRETLDSSLTTTDTNIDMGSTVDTWGVRGWALIYETNPTPTTERYEVLYYDGYLKSGSLDADPWRIISYNTDEAQRGRGDFGTTATAGTGLAWAAGDVIIEMFPNRLATGFILKDGVAVQDPKTYSVFQDVGVMFHNKSKTTFKATVDTYDGDANSTTGGTSDPPIHTGDKMGDALDLADVVNRVLGSPKKYGGPGFTSAEIETNDTNIFLSALEYSPGKNQLHAKSVIDEVATTSSHFYRLIWKDNDQKVLFESLQQRESGHAEFITLAAGSVTSLNREKNLADIRTGMLMRFKKESENLFDPQYIRYHNNSKNGDVDLEPVWKNSVTTDLYQGQTWIRGIWDGDGNTYYNNGKTPEVLQEVVRKATWNDPGWTITAEPEEQYMLALIYFTSTYDPITIESFELTFRAPGSYYIYSTDDYDGTTSWTSGVDDAEWGPLGPNSSKFNVPRQDLSTTLKETYFFNKRINAIKIGWRSGVDLLRPARDGFWIPWLYPGWDSELAYSNTNVGAHSPSETGTPAYDPWGYTGANQVTQHFSTKLGILNPLIQGDIDRAVFVRLEKTDDANPNPRRFVFPDSYNKMYPMVGHRVESVDLGYASPSEALSLGRQFLDDRLRQYLAHDYSLEGVDPFLNGGELPHLGQTIEVSDDSDPSTATAFTGVITAFSFSQDADGVSFDFRLEDYDRNKSAKYIRSLDAPE